MSSHTCDCPVCQDPYEDPRILDCGHTVCKACTDEIYRRHSARLRLACPICRQETKLDIYKRTNGLKKNFQLQEVLQLFQQAGLDTNIKCEDHDSQYMMYCETCKILLCAECIVAEHQDHALVTTDVRYQNIKDEFNNTLMTTEDIKDKIELASEEKDGEEKSIEKMHSFYTSRMNTCFEELEDQLSSRQEEMEEIHLRLTSKLRCQVTEDKGLLNNELHRLKSVTKSCEEALETKLYLIKNEEEMKGRLNEALENAKTVLDKITPTQKYPTLVFCIQQAKAAIPKIHFASNVYKVRVSAKQRATVKKCKDCDFDVDKIMEENEKLKEEITAFANNKKELQDIISASESSKMELQSKIDELERNLEEKITELQQMKRSVLDVLGFSREDLIQKIEFDDTIHAQHTTPAKDDIKTADQEGDGDPGTPLDYESSDGDEEDSSVSCEDEVE